MASDKDGGQSSPESKGSSGNSDLDFYIIPEPAPEIPKRGDGLYDGIPPGADLEEATLRKLDHENEKLRRELEERSQLHELRTTHAKRLFWLTVVWICVIWIMLLLQGFKQWFFPIPDYFKDWRYINFSLSDSVIIAFMTSATATVLGLYGIAAYWLYGKPRKDEGAVRKTKRK